MNALNNVYTGFDSWELHHSNTALTMFNIPFECTSKAQLKFQNMDIFFMQRPMFYVGSTKVGVCHRECNRHTQLTRYKQGKAIQVELAIRWWASEDNYSQFSTIALKHFETYAGAWTYMNMHLLNKCRHH